jgi:protein required for attachment to host cells
VLFKAPDVFQQRNEHNLMKDFADEISGYLNNRKIGTQLDALMLEAGPENLGANLIRCYEELVRLELVGGKEMDLVKAWVMDLKSF